MIKNKEIIIVSAVNFTEGGPFTILKESLHILSKNFSEDYKIIALVNNKEQLQIENIQYIDYPLAKKSWLIRLFYEYVYFYFLSLKTKPTYWLSLHDITPNVKCKNRIVYCHNPSPFYRSNKTDWYKNTKTYLFSKFYKYLYSINIKKNKLVIVQQSWLRDYFKNTWNINNVVVAYPNDPVNLFLSNDKIKAENNKIKKFFYPSFPRPFKNFEVICDSYELLPLEYRNKIEIYLTLKEGLNNYASTIYNKYKHLKGLNFIGLQPYEKVLEYYNEVDALIFPSKLETWGLPITEFSITGKPIFLADLPYAKETLGDYDKVCFFNVNSAKDLKENLVNYIDEELEFTKNSAQTIEQPFTKGWVALFNIILND